MSRWGRAIAILKVVLLLAIVAWLVLTFPKKDFDFLVSQKKNWNLLLQAMSLVLVGHILSYWRWLLLVGALGVPMRLTEAIRLGFLGTLFNQVSVGAVGGDLFKAIEAARKSNSKKTEIVASVLVDRAVGLLGLLIVAGVGLSLSHDLSPMLLTIQWGTYFLVGTAVAAFIAIIWFGRFLPLDWLSRLPWVGHTLHRLARACMIFQNRPGLAAQMIISSMLVHCCLTLSCYFISSAIYTSCPTLLQHFMTIPPGMAAATLPLTPGGMGTLELAIATLMEELPSLPDGYAPLMMAGMYRVFLIAVALVGAVYYFSGVGKDKTTS